MVSADGSPVTPDDSDSRKGTPVETTQESASPGREDLVRPAQAESPAAPGSHENPPPADRQDRNGSPDKPKKPKKPGRKQRKISRLVMEFQPDAVEMEHRKVAGGLRWTLYLVILLLASTIGWAWWAKVDRVVTAEGKLVTTEFVIEPPSSGAIHSFEADFGDTVKAGQILARLDPTFSEADVSKLETSINSITAEMRRLEAEQTQVDFDISGYEDDPVWWTQKKAFIDRQTRRESIEAQYDAEYRKLVAQKARNEADVQSRKDLVELREQMLKQSRELRQRNAGTKNEVMQNEAEAKYARSQLLTARNTVLETEAEFEVLERQRKSDRAENQATVSLELAQKRREYNDLVKDLQKARRANELVVITAPDDFPAYKVVEVADRSSVMQPGKPIMRLVPVNAELELEVRVEGKDIALIRNDADGQPKEVRIKLAAYPYMKHGTLNGHVKTINENVTEEGQPGMVRAYYVVRVAVHQDAGSPALQKVPDGNDSLRPGMAATAEIKVGRRRVINYFIYPLFRSLDNSIREP